MSCRKLLLAAGAIALIAMLVTAPAHAQGVNPGGWIQTNGWNILCPLLNAYGCGGGGVDVLNQNWLVPHDIGLEDPKAGTEWTDIDFDASPSGGFDLGGLAPNPIWVSNAMLNASFADYLAANPVPNSDLVNFEDLVNHINTYVIDGDPATEGIQPRMEGWHAIPNDNVAGFATTYVENVTGAPLPVEICFGSDDSGLLWVNNVKLNTVSSCRGSGDCQEVIPVVLPPGVSKIAGAAMEGGGGWNMKIGIRIAGTASFYTDANSDKIVFLGAGDPATVGQIQYTAERDPEQVFNNCDNIAVPVSIVGATPAGLAVGDADPLTLVEKITAPEPTALAVSDVTAGGEVSDLPGRIASPVVDFADHGIVGRACDYFGSSTVHDGGTDIYKQTARTDADIWDGGDTFAYAFNRYQGDFDVSVKIVSRTATGINDWGKFGIMAREALVPCARHTSQMRVTPNFGRLLTGRSVGGGDCNNSFNHDVFEPNTIGAEPAYMRLTRRAGVIQGWVSEDAAVEGNPTNDALWAYSTRTEDWSGDSPIYVGIAASEHSGGGCQTLEVEYLMLNMSGTPADVYADPVGKQITWVDVPRSDLNESGVGYTLAYNKPRDGGVVITGSVAGETTVADYGSFRSALNRFDQDSGPVGIFEKSQDIGNPPVLGSTTLDGSTYSVVGSGQDLWNSGDDFHFAYTRVDGDFEAVLRMVSRERLNSQDGWGRQGIMSRYTCNRDSKYSIVMTNPPRADGTAQATPRYQIRRNNGENGGNTHDRYVIDSGVFQREGNFPSWFKLVRKGKTLLGYHAEDLDGAPERWLLAGTDTAVTIPSTTLVGVANQGRDDQNESPDGVEIRVDNVSIVETDPPADQVATPVEELARLDFDSAEDVGVVVRRGGDFTPGVAGERLRILDQGFGSSANCVWWGVPATGDDGVPLLTEGFLAEFDVYLSKNDAEGNPVNPPVDPADGMTFAVVSTGVSDGLATAVGPWNPGAGQIGVEVASLCGDGGGALGYHWGPMNWRVEVAQSFSVEIDIWEGGGDDWRETWYGSAYEPPGVGAPNFDGTYHIGLNANGNVNSLQTNLDIGTPTDALPDVFAPEGVRMQVLYLPTGRVQAWAQANTEESEPVLVIDTYIQPLPGGDLILGFTAGTGGATVNADVDNVVLSTVCAEVADGVAISGETAGEVNAVDITLDATFTGADGDVTYSWTVGDTAIAQVSGAADEATVVVECLAGGSTSVTVEAADALCGDTVTDVVDVTCDPGGIGAIVFDANSDGGCDLSDAVRLFNYLFNADETTLLPCLGQDHNGPGNTTILDWNGRDGVDMSDGISALQWRFLGTAPPHVLDTNADATTCIRVKDCDPRVPPVCTP